MSIKIFVFGVKIFEIRDFSTGSDRFDGEKDRRADANDPFGIAFGRRRERLIRAAGVGEKLRAFGGLRFANERKKLRKYLPHFKFIAVVQPSAARKLLGVRVGEGVGKIVEQNAEAKSVLRGAKTDRKPLVEIAADLF